MSNPKRGLLLARIEQAAQARLIGAIDAYLSALWGSFDTAELDALAAGLGTAESLRTPAQRAAVTRFDTGLAALATWKPGKLGAGNMTDYETDYTNLTAEERETLAAKYGVRPDLLPGAPFAPSGAEGQRQAKRAELAARLNVRADLLPADYGLEGERTETT